MKELKLRTPTPLDELNFDIVSKYNKFSSALTDARREKGETQKILEVLEDVPSKFKRELDDSVYCIDLVHNKDKKALLAGGFFGDHPLPTRYLMSLLPKLGDINFDVSVIPLVGVKEALEYERTKERKYKVNPDTKRLVLNEIEKGCDMYVQYSQATPFLDGFFVKIPWDSKFSEESSKTAHNVTKHLIGMDFEVGVYSLRNDGPTYPVLRDSQKDSILNQAGEKCKSLGFYVNNLDSTIEASLHLLSNSSKGKQGY